MTKQELIRQTAKGAKVTQEDAERVLAAALDAALKAIYAGDSITIKGFGKLETRTRKGREQKNTHGEAVTIPDKVKLHFAASDAIEARLQPGKEGVTDE